MDGCELSSLILSRVAAIANEFGGGSWLTGHKRDDPRAKTVLSVAPHQLHSKAKVPQHPGDPRTVVKLLAMSLLVATIRRPALPESHDAARELFLRNIVPELHQAGPVVPFHEPLLDSAASSRFGHIENQ